MGKFFKRITYDIIDDYLDKRIITNEGMNIMSLYSCANHGTSYSQQSPYKRDDFYKSIRLVIGDTSIWLACLAEVMEDYLIRCGRYTNSSLNSVEVFSEETEDRIRIINYLLEKVFNVKCRIEKYYPLSNKATIFKVFENTKWIIK